MLTLHILALLFDITKIDIETKYFTKNKNTKFYQSLADLTKLDKETILKEEQNTDRLTTATKNAGIRLRHLQKGVYRLKRMFFIFANVYLIFSFVSSFSVGYGFKKPALLVAAKR